MINRPVFIREAITEGDDMELVILYFVIAYACGYHAGFEDHAGRFLFGLLWPCLLFYYGIVFPIIHLFSKRI
jgi:hypothetical protein